MSAQLEPRRIRKREKQFFIAPENILNFYACAWDMEHAQPPKANTSGGVSTSLPLRAVT